MNGAWHRFRAAALMLARSGTVKERLQAAYRLQLADIDSEQLPIEVRNDFESLRGALTREAVHVLPAPVRRRSRLRLAAIS